MPCPLQARSLMLYEGSLLFTGNDSCSSSCLQVVRNELVNVGLNQLTVNDPGFFRQHVAGFRERGRLEKDIPWRSPIPCVSRQLPVAVVWSLGAIFAEFRFTDHRIRRAVWSIEISNCVAHAVFTNTDNPESLVLVFLVETGGQRRFVTPVRTPRREINNHDEFFAGNQRAQVDRLVVLEIV